MGTARGGGGRGWTEVPLRAVRSGGAARDWSFTGGGLTCGASGAPPSPGQGAGGALRARVQPRPGVRWKEEARRRCPPGPGSVIHSDSGSGAVSA